ncbi:hypothetical protein [Pedobacter sp. N23S346]|uniref:hypothetical protein n=1 Tax=Pedobacter sp. N23S346 TaxID=3402750 RepID=UPI003AC78B14
MKDITLILNAAPSDADYAELNIIHLIKQHSSISERILIIDTSKTKHGNELNEDYQNKLDKIIAIAEKLLRSSLITQIIYTHSYINFNTLYKKFLNKFIESKHEYDYRGAPIGAYLIGFDLTQTKFQLRYDIDMLLHQPDVVDWTEYAISVMNKDVRILCSSPSTAPKKYNNLLKDEKFCWFSTRCSLINMEIFYKMKHSLSIQFRIQSYLRKFLKKSYPPAFETIVYQMMLKNKVTSLYINSHKAYLLHPENKNAYYINILPKIISCIENNNIPDEQLEKEYINLSAWT